MRMLCLWGYIIAMFQKCAVADSYQFTTYVACTRSLPCVSGITGYHYVEPGHLRSIHVQHLTQRCVALQEGCASLLDKDA